MKTFPFGVMCTFVWMAAVGACISSSSPAGSGPGGAGVSSSGGSAGAAAKGGAAGTSSNGGASGGTRSSGGASGTTLDSGSPDVSLSNDIGVPPVGNIDAGEAGGVPSAVSVWVEAESGQMMTGASVAVCGKPGDGQYGAAANCTTDMLKDDASCCSGGKMVHSLLGASGSGCFGKPLTCGSGVILTVPVPADGMYDVTWWFHCGSNDNYGDVKCGGLRYSAGTPGLCRPHEIVVNGFLTGDAATKAYYYQFPCWATSWSLIHSAVTTLSLKAGDNTVYIHAPNDYISAGVDNVLDGVDLDVIHVTAVGQGIGTRVTPVAGAN